MAPTRHNPNGLEDGMVVRKVSSPSKVFRVRGNPDAGGATFVALSKGERTVLNGNARNYRPESDAEVFERVGHEAAPEAPVVETNDEQTPELQDPELQDPELQDPELQDPELQDPELQDPELQDPELQDPDFSNPDLSGPVSDDDPVHEPETVRSRRSLYAVEAYREPGIVELCDRMRDAVARLDDDTCSPEDAAAIVRAAAELNWAVAAGR